MQITRDEIVYTLKNRRDIIRRFRKVMDDMEVIRRELLTSTIFIPSTTAQISGMPRGGGGHHDLQNVLNATEMCVNEYIETFYVESLLVMEDNARLTRIMTCMYTLPAEEFNAVHDIYILKKSWKSVQDATGMSHMTLSRRLSDGISRIQELYESDYTIQSLIGMQQGGVKKEENDDTRGEKQVAGAVC